jgi:transcriptional regulator with XRE-family HTH domain
MSVVEVSTLSTGFTLQTREKLEGMLGSLRAQLIAGGTSALSAPNDAPLSFLAEAAGTSVWVGTVSAPESAPVVLDELKDMTGLTWDQLARVMGVSRRSIHLWLNGRPLSAEKEERLHEIAHVVRTLAGKSQIETRTRMLDKSGGQSVFDQLIAGFDEAALGLAFTRAASTEPAVLFEHSARRLSNEARAARRSPIHALDLLESSSAMVVVEPAKLKRARPMKRKTDER